MSIITQGFGVFEEAIITRGFGRTRIQSSGGGIVTKGFGLFKETIVTQGYGKIIERAVTEAIEEVTRRRPRGSSAASRRRKEEDKLIVEWTVSATIIDVNNEDFILPLRQSITKKLREQNLDISVENIELRSLENNEIKIEVKIKEIRRKK